MPLASSRKGEALSGIVTHWSTCLYAIPARAALGRDDNQLSELAAFPNLVTSAPLGEEAAALHLIHPNP